MSQDETGIQARILLSAFLLHANFKSIWNSNYFKNFN